MALTAGTDQLESFNPATGERLGAVELTPPEDVGAVVDAVAKVQPFWAQLKLQDRARCLERAAQVLIDEGDDIRDLIVREQGKPRNEAFAMEVLPTIDAVTWISRAGQDILADEKISMPQVFLKTKSSAFTYERVYVLREVSERFLEGVVAGAQRLRVGDPLGWDTEIGPMVSREQFEVVQELVDDAVAKGASLECGGPVESPAGLGAGRFYAPTVLTGVSHEMRIMREEIFGPVLPITVVDSEDEAIALANDSDFGLGASVWTSDRAKGERVARELEAGMVWINDHMFSHGACQCSWGGVKESGLGRTHSKFGLYECVNIKLRVWEGSAIKNAWWHPYDETLGKALRQTAKVLYGRPSIRAAALRDGLGPLLTVGTRLARDALKR